MLIIWFFFLDYLLSSDDVYKTIQENGQILRIFMYRINPNFLQSIIPTTEYFMFFK